MGGVDDELRDEIFFPRPHAEPSGAAAPLLAIDRNGRALEIAGMRYRDGDLFVGNQILHLQLRRLIQNLSAAFIAKFLACCFQFLDDHCAQIFSPRPGWPRTLQCARALRPVP